jgi:hypothetical protein
MATAPRRRTREQLWAEMDALEGGFNTRGAAASSEGLSRAQSFDASKAVNQYAGGAWNSIAGQLRQQLRASGGAAVGAGRLNTGFYDEDQGEIINRATSDFQDRMAQTAVQAAGMQQQNDASILAYGERQQDRGAQLTQSRWELAENDAREAEERKRNRKRGIGSAIGGIIGAGVGAIAGGPAGASVGWGAGSSVGGMF